MNYGAKGSEMVAGRNLRAQSPEMSGIAKPEAGRSTAKRNFILQQGFEDPAPAVCSIQYSALVFQTKVVLVWIVAGMLFQSPAVFAVLGGLLWWSALFPKLNPFRALYNYTLGSRAGAFHLAPSPAPRRAAETEAGTIALASALVSNSGLTLAAYAVEIFFLAAALAVLIGSFCFGTFNYHILRGNSRFALRTLPWAR